MKNSTFNSGNELSINGAKNESRKVELGTKISSSLSELKVTISGNEGSNFNRSIVEDEKHIQSNSRNYTRNDSYEKRNEHSSRDSHYEKYRSREERREVSRDRSRSRECRRSSSREHGHNGRKRSRSRDRRCDEGYKHEYDMKRDSHRSRDRKRSRSRDRKRSRSRDYRKSHEYSNERYSRDRSRSRVRSYKSIRDINDSRSNDNSMEEYYSKSKRKCYDSVSPSRENEIGYSSKNMSSNQINNGPVSSIATLENRHRKISCWDISPPGFSSMTTDEVKSTGLFMPSWAVVGRQNFQGLNDPTRIAITMLKYPYQPTKDTCSLSYVLSCCATYNSRNLQFHNILFVSNIPTELELIDDIVNIFDEKLRELRILHEGQSCISSYVYKKQDSFAFFEVNTDEQFQTILQTTFIHDQTPLLIKRGIDFIPYYLANSALIEQNIEITPSSLIQQHNFIIKNEFSFLVTSCFIEQLKIITNSVNEVRKSISLNSDETLLANIPKSLLDDEIHELLSCFGSIKSIYIPKVDLSPESPNKGWLLVSWSDSESNDIARDALNKLEIGHYKLFALDAALVLLNPSTCPAFFPSIASSSTVKFVTCEISNIIELHNLISLEELEEDAVYDILLQNIREESCKFGTVLDVYAPRQCDFSREFEYPPPEMCNRVFVVFESHIAAIQAAEFFSKSQFNERNVFVSFVPPLNYYSFQV